MILFFLTLTLAYHQQYNKSWNDFLANLWCDSYLDIGP